MVDAPRFANAEDALDGVSWGEILYDSTSTEVGLSGGELAGLGRQYCVFVVRSRFLSVGGSLGELREVGLRSPRREGGGFGVSEE